MVDTVLMQLVTLGLYVIFMGFCFCDGFKLHIGKKLVWFSVFLAISICVFKSGEGYNLVRILPIPTLLAIVLCGYENIKSKRVK
ncbi:MAG: hypothetical protein A2Z72_05930 [Omnitrophica bacterium RBG_13_46_9]|nr:MAG: hypothetical protein A2Z72_05930 [Omnitrophica bacterium RBG_13_46_9]